VWDGLRQDVKGGRLSKQKIPYVRKFSSTSPDWGDNDIVVMMNRHLELEIYRELPTKPEIYQRHGRDEDTAIKEANAAKSWNRKMWKLVNEGNTPSEAKYMIKESEKLWRMFAIFYFMIGAVGAFPFLSGGELVGVGRKLFSGKETK
jgi:hypothetical protein